MGYKKGGVEEEQVIISLSSTNSEKVCWITTVVEVIVFLLGSIKTYLGTSPPAFTTLQDLELYPFVASIMSLTPQELLGLLPDGTTHSQCICWHENVTGSC